MHTVNVRLTIDLIPEVSVVIYREGEPPENYMVDAEELVSQAEEELAAEEETAEADEPEVSEAAEEGEDTQKASE
jgi:hypothetical protein